MYPEHSRPLSILNFYNPPKEYTLFKPLIHFSSRLYRDCDFIIGGDFNAPHVIWGYPRTLRPGRILNDTLNGAQMTVYNKPPFHYSRGYKHQQSTMPDLTAGRGVRDVTWNVTDERLLSDHYIIQITIPTCIRSPKRKISLTNWKIFRDIRDTSQRMVISRTGLKHSNRPTNKPHRNVSLQPHQTTQTLILSVSGRGENDSCAPFATQPNNSRLAERVAELTEHIKEHCATLAKDQWKGNL
ncbi:hypothetical protein HPB48_015878 [Haemaphysalis longicornis]|uniref:Endonuclease/exonuclease/phosphatase domain-containing protein n=1 Tax=Haemaphysalis longicornis TaxID=44386 RepID=A0A9J6GSL3_HAELO|nr:hypothetical protein HPB48_015878 [Haemaphysalis longicornis]